MYGFYVEVIVIFEKFSFEVNRIRVFRVSDMDIVVREWICCECSSVEVLVVMKFRWWNIREFIEVRVYLIEFGR